MLLCISFWAFQWSTVVHTSNCNSYQYLILLYFFFSLSSIYCCTWSSNNYQYLKLLCISFWACHLSTVVPHTLTNINTYWNCFCVFPFEPFINQLYVPQTLTNFNTQNFCDFLFKSLSINCCNSNSNNHQYLKLLWFSFQPFIYQLLYLVFSILGNYNYFFFAAHLLDVAVGVAALRIILEAITHNGKQLVNISIKFQLIFG